MIALLLGAALALAAPEDVKFERKELPFTDEAKQDESFLAFRKKLLETVKKRDAKALLEAVDPKVKNSFGGEDGIKEFRATWKLDDKNAAKSDLWAELGKVLKNGGAFKDGRFQAPYYSASWPEGFDAFEFVAVIEDKAPLHAAASAKSKVVARLPRLIVARSDGMKDTPEYTYVRTSEGKLGYVANAQLGSPVGYRAFFEKRGGAWRLTFFLAGD